MAKDLQWTILGEKWLRAETSTQNVFRTLFFCLSYITLVSASTCGFLAWDSLYFSLLHPLATSSQENGVVEPTFSVHLSLHCYCRSHVEHVSQKKHLR